MTRLRKIAVVFVISLLFSLGAAELWSGEIYHIEGRPWDIGSIGISKDKDKKRVYREGTSLVGGIEGRSDLSQGQQATKMFEKVFSDVFSFLNP